jgi:phosphoheptose isomerase
MAMNEMHNSLPPDFRDRPRHVRWFMNLLVLLRIKAVKTTCCESFRKEGKMVACKGCATVYDTNSKHFLYRFLGRHAKRRLAKTTEVLQQAHDDGEANASSDRTGVV